MSILNVFRKREKPIPLLIAIAIHVVLLVLLANIIIAQPSVRKVLFKSKIVSSADLNVNPIRPTKEVAITSKKAATPVKEPIIKEQKALTVDKALDVPALGKNLDLNLDDMQPDFDLAEATDVDINKALNQKLNFKGKAQISGKGKRIKGRLVFPISMYSDWNNDPTTVPNLMNEVARRTNIEVSIEEQKIDFGNKRQMFNYPIIYLNGHQDFKWTPKEEKNLREYLMRGGFLFVVNDNAFKGPFEDALFRETRKIFPKDQFAKVPMGHPIYHIFYSFDQGKLPDALYKGIPMEGYALHYKGRMVIYYLASGDACDAWAEADPSKWPGTTASSHRYAYQPGEPGVSHAGAGQQGIENAFKLGVNVVVYVLSNM
jgi:hypothetical protein